jgi:RNA polymerase sigma factor (sigma-70 family)
MLELALERCRQIGKKGQAESELWEAVANYGALTAEDVATWRTERESSPVWNRQVTAAKLKYIHYRNIVLQSNMRLVISILKWPGKEDGKGSVYLSNDTNPMDVIMEGFLGLAIAFDKFDIKRELKFSTYATGWVRQSMLRYLAREKGGNIRLPNHMVERIEQLSRAIVTLETKHGRLFANDPEFFHDKLARQFRGRLNAEQIEFALGKRLLCVQESLDTPEYENNGESSDADISKVSQVPAPEFGDKVEMRDIGKQLEDIIGRLTVRESQIIRFRFGFGGADEETLKDIADKFELSKERIRQIERDALEKIKKELVEIGINASFIGVFSF